MKKVKIDRELLMLKMTKLMKFTPSTTPVVPAFDNIKFSILGDTMIMVACNTNIQCKMTCQCKATEPFSICIPAKLFFKTISLFRENEVTISVKTDTKIELKSGKSKYNITLDCQPNAFPIMETNESGSDITLSQYFLKLGLRSAGKFVDDENANQNMTAINIADVENKMVFTAVQGGMMCRVAVRPISIGKWEPANLPVETAGKVAAMMEDKGEVTIIHGGGKICFFTGKDSDEFFEIMSVTANIKFPDSEKVFGRKPEDVIVINTVEFTDAVKRLRLYAESGEKPSFKIESRGHELVLSSTDSLLSKDGEDVIDPISYTEKPINRNFFSDQIIQIMTNVDSDEFEFFHTDKNNYPCFIIPKVATDEENIFSFLIASLLD